MADDVVQIQQYLLDGERDGLQLHFSRFHLREIKYVVDDVQQRISGVADFLQITTLVRGWVCPEGEMRHPHDGVHWRADLMAHIRQEFGLGPVRFFRFDLGLA